MSQQEHLHQIKRLIIALGCSGLLNVILLALVIYGFIKERPPTPYFELKPVTAEENAKPTSLGLISSILKFRQLSTNQLQSLLCSHQPIEEGYCERDLALACLIDFHQIDLKRALGTETSYLQRRQISYGKRQDGSSTEIAVYPALSSADWSAITNFISRERWPQPPKGQFLLLKHQENDIDPSLADAFALTTEFQAVEALFARSQYHVEHMELIQLLLGGDWKQLSDFVSQQRAQQDLSDQKRKQLLLSYVNKKSKIAAYLLLKTDFSFAVKQLNDSDTLSLLALLEEKSPDSEKFAQALLSSSRSDAVWKMAATKLKEFKGESQGVSLLPVIPAATATKPAIKGIEKPQVIPEAKKPIAVKPTSNRIPPLSTKDKLYIIQEGDSLWKISRRFNVDIDLLRKHNRLKTDLLKPGSALRIPVVG